MHAAERPVLAAALFLVAGLLALRLVWKLVTWASDLSGHPQVRLLKVGVLAASAAGPLLLVPIWTTAQSSEVSRARGSSAS